jgi:phosphoribosyl 1,2-cyclic phosphodiesterase
LKIQIIGSGSSGNCFRVDDGQTALLLECGLPIQKIKAGCGYNLSGIAGCCVSHEHGDHAKAVNDLMKSGVDVYMTEGTARACNAQTYRLKLWHRDGTDKIGLPFYHTERIGTFAVKPFAVHHDAAEPVNYLIESKATNERLLFVTDTQYIDYRFSGLTHIMAEANFSDDALAEPENAPRRHRLRRTHMSLEHCIELLKANDLSQIQEIWLIHLSQSNGNAEEFKYRVQEATGCEVHIA